ncbi:MAG: hypothetical protein ACI89U_000496 [Gammaproteobacteria bacterium]|jgi:hypothetical protein
MHNAACREVGMVGISEIPSSASAIYRSPHQFNDTPHWTVIKEMLDPSENLLDSEEDTKPKKNNCKLSEKSF